MDYQIIDALYSSINRMHIDLKCAFPVELRDIAKYQQVEYYARVMPPDIDGVYIRSRSGAAHIYVNIHPSKPPGRQRFTGAHEITHHLVAEQLGLQEAVFLDVKGCKKSLIERLCNMGAAALLMPAKSVEYTYSGLRLYSRAEIIHAVAVIFGVTPAAARVRLEELRLIKGG